MRAKKFTATEINKAEKVIREHIDIWSDVKITRYDDYFSTTIEINEGDYMTSPVIGLTTKICDAYELLGYHIHYGLVTNNNEPTIEIRLYRKH